MQEKYSDKNLLCVPVGTKLVVDESSLCGIGIVRYTGSPPFAPFATQNTWSVKFALLLSIFSMLLNLYVLWRRY